MVVKNPLPRAVFDQHIIALGKTRSGKSSMLRYEVEDLLDHGETCIIIDPKGDWWGIKSSADGKEKGYPLVIFGGEHKDVPLNAQSGAAVAELLATGKRSALIDLGGWMVGERTRWFIDFASHFFKFHRGKHYLVIDEVHNFAPKGKIFDPDAGKMLHWANRLASEGLGKGINLIAASQRPQKVHNDFLTSCETLIAMRVIHKADRDALKDWLDACGDAEIGKEVLNTVAQNKRGEAWVYSPEAAFGPVKIQFPKFKTYDSFAPQGMREGALKGWADVDLEDVTKKLQAAVEEAKATDPKLLQIRIRELERELASRKPTAPEQVEVEVQVQDPELIRQLNDRMRWQADAEQHYARMKPLIEDIFTDVQNLRGMTLPIGMNVKYIDLPAPPQRKYREIPLEGRTTSSTLFRSVAETSKYNESQNDLPTGETAVLQSVAQYPQGVRREQITVLSGYKKSSRDAYIARLKQKSYLAERGDMVVATKEGVAALGPNYVPLPPNGQALQTYWLAKLPTGEAKVLKILIARAGKPVERDQLTVATGYQKSSRDAYLARLAAKYLVESDSPGLVRASDSLFA